MGRHRRTYRRSGRLPWTKADTDRVNAKLLSLVEIDAGILANNPPIDWLIDLRRRYRSVCEDHARWESDPKLKEWYRRAIADSDERSQQIQELAEEQLAEHARRSAN